MIDDIDNAKLVNDILNHKKKIRGGIHGQDVFKVDYEQYRENSFKKNNALLTRPKGWLIMDSFNNPFFPINAFTVDTMKFNTSRLSIEFHKRYGGNVKDLFLPWHYTIEVVDEMPFVIQNRPLLYKTPIKGFNSHITIMIIGDSNIDMYNGKFYKQMAHNIINPYKSAPGIRMSNQRETFTFFTGSNFNKDNLFKELH